MRFPTYIESVILFGSHARDDADNASDMDICVFVLSEDFAAVQAAQQFVAEHYGVDPSSVPVYGPMVLERMREVGSLFLWHLRLEGHILYDPNNLAAKIFAGLHPYTNYASDLAMYQDMLDGVRRAVAIDADLSEIDLHILQILARGACILLTMRAGNPSFGRASVYHHARNSFPGLPVSPEMYDQLCKWHLLYLRGMGEPSGLPDTQRCHDIVNTIDEVLRFTSERTS